MMCSATTNSIARSADELLFTENESNLERLWGVPNRSPFVKDSINDAVVQGKIELINPNKLGTKAAAHYRFLISPNESRTIRCACARSTITLHPATPSSPSPQPTLLPSLALRGRRSQRERGRGQHDFSMISTKSLAARKPKRTNFTMRLRR